MKELCPYCGGDVRLVKGSDLYYSRRDIAHKNFYACDKCDAWVGCHSGTAKPLGRLANAALRKMRQEAHAAFDPLWRQRRWSRSKAYRWLGSQMSLPKDECHIGMMDEDECRILIEICKREYQEITQ